MRDHLQRCSLLSLTLTLALTLALLLLLPSGSLFGQEAVADAAQRARLTDHVVLISIDGLRPEFYLDPTWPAPMLRQLLAEGSHAEGVRGVFPSVTYPSHTTMITGVRPDRHGVYYNSPFEPAGETGRWYWEEEAIRVPTLWDRVRAVGGTSASIGWPVSVGAPIDYNVPEIWSLDADEDPVEVTRQATRPPGLLAEIEREATGRLRRDNFTIDHMERDDHAGAAAAWLLETYRPNLLTVHLIETDHFQHEDGRESPRVRRAVAVVDRAVSQIYEAAERAGILGRTTFVITGDHGHVDLHTQLAPNVWLVAAGLMEPRTDRGRWRAAFHTSSASAFLHLADPADEEAATRARQALDALPRGLRSLFRIVERDELDRLGAAPEAAFALALEPGVHATSSAVGPAVRPIHGASHGYLPDLPQIHTGFVAAGAGVRRGEVAALLRLEDVGAFVATLLQLDTSGMDGIAPLGFLDQPAAPN